MSKKIFIALDSNCYTETKEITDTMGGSERYLITLARWIKETEDFWATYDIYPPSVEFDLAIHSNSFMRNVKAKKHICWSGSTHTDGGWNNNYDEVVNVSEHMKRITKRGIVIPACVTDDIKKTYAENYLPNRLVSNCNPVKYIKHMNKILEILDSKNIDYRFVFSGGHTLYSDNFPLGFTIPTGDKIIYKGILTRKKMIQMLAGGHVYIAPAFTGEAPTFEVAPLEAMKMGITTILPNRSPYNEIHGPLGAILCNNEEEMVEEIIKAFERGRVEYDVFKYSEYSVKNQWIRFLKEIA